MTIPAAELRNLDLFAAGLAEAAPIAAHFTACLSNDFKHDGPVARSVASQFTVTEDLFGIRLLAGVHWLVLKGQTPELSAHLRDHLTGATDSSYLHRAWELVVQAVQEHPTEIRTALSRPVQQHQPRRAEALLTGLTMLGAPRVRLLEIGAAAGINLMVDRFGWYGHGWEWGDPDSPMRLTSRGRPPGDLQIVARAGCDLVPRDPGNPHDALILQSFLPHEREIDRLELKEALEVAADSPLRVDEADAVDWLEEQLAGPSDPYVHTVVWHSLFWLYLPPWKQRRIEELLADAARRMPISRICLEPRGWTSMPTLQLTVYS
ncbi:DUF2332 domain-containing protein [Streptomyces sp. NPDC046909]|uniref:DUF2332 domain-containing protein n=1 Tax=Streptomyces sp. NPDC046909 TaxID=3155617 RepID=UPI0033FBE653